MIKIIQHDTARLITQTVTFFKIKKSRTEYLKAYRVKRKKHFKELKVTIDIKTFNALKVQAKKYNLTPNKLLLKQALCYTQSNYLVPNDTNEKLVKLIHLFRNIANNINQVAKHSNIFKKVLSTKAVVTNLARLEKELVAFITQPPQKLEMHKSKLWDDH